MDLSRLDPHERLAGAGATLVIVAGLLSAWGGLVWLSILSAIGALAVLALPVLSPETTLPAGKGQLLAALGFLAAGAALIVVALWRDLVFRFGFSSAMLFVAVAGTLMMAWAGWQALGRSRA